MHSTTTVLAAQGIVGMSQELFGMIVAVGSVGGLALGILVGIRNGWKQGLGGAIGGVIGGIILSIVIANAAGFRDSSNQELKDRGVVPASIYGQ